MRGRTDAGNEDLRALKLLAKELLGYAAMSLARATKAGELIEIEVDDNG
jgi:hypothetical protein